jgi:polar amino acid transport system permease protein
MTSTPGKSRLQIMQRASRLPWWAFVTAILGFLFVLRLTTDASYNEIFLAIVGGVQLTIAVTGIAFVLSLAVGLVIALARLSKNPVIYQTATFFVENIRGVPMLVLLLYVAFVFIPGIAEAINALGGALITSELAPLRSIGEGLTAVRARDVNNTVRVIIALVIAYSVFISEVYRAGIESIDRGQMEAARSLGMTWWQGMRYVVLPQAIRNVLPALGNDFISMLKDSSLVSVLGVQDITGLGRVYAAGNFKYFETFNVMTFLYLSMTLILSVVVRRLEQRSRPPGQK